MRRQHGNEFRVLIVLGASLFQGIIPDAHSLSSLDGVSVLFPAGPQRESTRNSGQSPTESCEPPISQVRLTDRLAQLDYRRTTESSELLPVVIQGVWCSSNLPPPGTSIAFLKTPSSTCCWRC